MEHKHAKAYSNIFKLLQKTSVNFQNPLHSPNREKRSDHHHHHHHHKTHKGKGFSGHMMSMSLVPIEARRNLKNNNDPSLANQEPTSPKISCMGQIKHKHKHKKNLDKANSFSVAKEDNSEVFSPKEANKKRASMLKRMFTISKPAAARKSFDHSADQVRRPLPDRAPGLSQMKRFASGRETFTSFDWTAHQVAPETDSGTFYSYYERGDSEQYEDEDEDEFTIPFSAPISFVKGIAFQPRKEVNLWKRRTMNPLAPLQLNSTVG